ncbi:MAG: hypothetical protein L6Q95_00670 [Planctomycetes bacterium]|nr:hypothetical protein [Planctomycetota bacterium]
MDAIGTRPAARATWLPRVLPALLATALGACGTTCRLYDGPARRPSEVATISGVHGCGTRSGTVSLYLTGVNGTEILAFDLDDPPGGSPTAEVLPGSHDVEATWLLWRREKTSAAITAAAATAAVLLSLTVGPVSNFPPSKRVPDLRGSIRFRHAVEAGHRYTLDVYGPPTIVPPPARRTPELSARYLDCWREVGSFSFYSAPPVTVWLVDRTGIQQILREGEAR